MADHDLVVEDYPPVSPGPAVRGNEREAHILSLSAKSAAAEDSARQSVRANVVAFFSLIFSAVVCLPDIWNGLCFVYALFPLSPEENALASSFLAALKQRAQQNARFPPWLRCDDSENVVVSQRKWADRQVLEQLVHETNMPIYLIHFDSLGLFASRCSLIFPGHLPHTIEEGIRRATQERGRILAYIGGKHASFFYYPPHILPEYSSLSLTLFLTPNTHI